MRETRFNFSTVFGLLLFVVANTPTRSCRRIIFPIVVRFRKWDNISTRNRIIVLDRNSFNSNTSTCVRFRVIDDDKITRAYRHKPSAVCGWCLRTSVDLFVRVVFATDQYRFWSCAAVPQEEKSPTLCPPHPLVVERKTKTKPLR